jgi:hypothetical protein
LRRAPRERTIARVSLHPLNSEMLVAEVALVGGATWGGVALWRGDHPALALVAWVVAALAVLQVVVLAVLERQSYPPRLVLGRVALAVVTVGYVVAVGWGVRALVAAGWTPLAVVAAVAGLVVGRVALAPVAAVLVRSR